MTKSEVVMVVPSEITDIDGLVATLAYGYYEFVTQASVMYDFTARDQVENDDDFLQIIPYVALLCGDKVLVYKRGTGDDRLAQQLSIGLGGHINTYDSASYGDSFLAIVYKAAWRELHEEVGLSEMNGTLQTKGVIIDKTTPVNRVHAAMLFAIKMQPDDVAEIVPSDELDSYEFVGLEQKPDGLEVWSDLFWDEIARTF